MRAPCGAPLFRRRYSSARLPLVSFPVQILAVKAELAAKNNVLANKEPLLTPALDSTSYLLTLIPDRRIGTESTLEAA